MSILLSIGFTAGILIVSAIVGYKLGQLLMEFLSNL